MNAIRELAALIDALAMIPADAYYAPGDVTAEKVAEAWRAKNRILAELAGNAAPAEDITKRCDALCLDRDIDTESQRNSMFRFIQARGLTSKLFDHLCQEFPADAEERGTT